MRDLIELGNSHIIIFSITAIYFSDEAMVIQDMIFKLVVLRLPPFTAVLLPLKEVPLPPEPPRPPCVQ